MFKPYQSVMVLSLRNGQGKYFDTRGTFIKVMTMGTQKGKYKIEVNSTVIYMDLDRLMDHDEYFKIYHKDKAKLPENANGKLDFLEGDYPGGSNE